MTMIRYHSDVADSGIFTGFYVGNPYFERDVFERVFPAEVINPPEGIALAEYYGITKPTNYGDGVGPSWSQIAAILDYLEGQET